MLHLLDDDKNISEDEVEDEELDENLVLNKLEDFYMIQEFSVSQRNWEIVVLTNQMKN